MTEEVVQITRKEALGILAEDSFQGLNTNERANLLSDLALEFWDDDDNDDWARLPASLKEDITESEEWDVDDPKYAPAIKVWLIYKMRYYSHDYLAQHLQMLGYAKSALRFEPIDAEICPCCGYKTLSERGVHDICPICWWEDEGFDAPDDGTRNHLIVEDEDGVVTEVDVPLNELGVGSNEVDLLSARINFLQTGISNPRREDLRPFQEQSAAYEQVRKFVWNATKLELSEPAIGWSIQVYWREDHQTQVWH